jgi:hypothetical protein
MVHRSTHVLGHRRSQVEKTAREYRPLDIKASVLHLVSSPIAPPIRPRCGCGDGQCAAGARIVLAGASKQRAVRVLATAGLRAPRAALASASEA